MATKKKKRKIKAKSLGTGLVRKAAKKLGGRQAKLKAARKRAGV